MAKTAEQGALESRSVGRVLERVYGAQQGAYGRKIRTAWDRPNAWILIQRFGGDVGRASAWIDLVFESELRRSANLTLSKLVCWSLTPLEEIDRIVRAWLREKAGGR